MDSKNTIIIRLLDGQVFGYDALRYSVDINTPGWVKIMSGYDFSRVVSAINSNAVAGIEFNTEED